MEKSPRQTFTLRMNPKLKKALQIQALEEKRSFSDLLEEAALRYLTERAA